MSDDRKPKDDKLGSTTIPPELRPFVGRTAHPEAGRRSDNPAMDAAFAKIKEALGDDEDDTQELDPDRGVGNASAYIGPRGVPKPAPGRAVTAKVKIDPAKVKSDPPPAMGMA